MSEEITETEPAPSRAEQVHAAWEASQVEVPASESDADVVLTKEDVAGDKSTSEGAPDRALVAPSIREFLRAQQTEAAPSGLEKEISDLRGALDALATPKDAKEVPVDQQMLQKLEALETREAERLAKDAEAKDEEEYNNRVRAMREGVIENINSREEDYPGLIALEQQETVFNALVQRLQEGEDQSEDDIASEVETGLRKVYDKLHVVYGSSSKDKPTSERKQTLNPGLVGSDEPADMDSMTRQEKINYLWAKNAK